MNQALHTATSPNLRNFLQNLADLPKSLSLSGLAAGFIIVLITYTGPLLIVLQAAQAGQLSEEQTSSWVWAVIVGNGIATILLSLLFRQPITIPYSTAGAALLISSIGLFPFSEVIGAYLICAIGITLLGVSGLFGRLMKLIPQAVVMAVLAGVLLRFGLGIFNALDDNPNNPLIIVSMVLVYMLLKRIKFAAPSLGAMITGLVLAGALGLLNFSAVRLIPSLPSVFMPSFSLNATLSLALPLFALAISSQYAPGQAVLLANGYDAPINSILSLTGLLSIGLAFFGGHGNVLGALTAALVVSPDAQADIDKRYASAVASGFWHVLFGIFGATVIGLFAGFPIVFVSTIAGLSLSGIIANSLYGAMSEPESRDAAIIAFLCTAGDFKLLSIGAPFWGLVAGSLVFFLMSYRRKKAEDTVKEVSANVATEA
jgi:benzoate membrane transport protein